MTADPALYADGPVADKGAPDAAIDLPRPDVQAVDVPRADSPLPDLTVPDALATYLRKWVTVAVPSSPVAVWGSKLAYQATTGHVVLYGGRDQSAVASSWRYDGTSWHKLCDPCPPGPRMRHGLVWHAKRGTVVLFGGTSGTVKNDLWELVAGVWTSVTPSGTPPSPRSGAYVAYDPLRDRMVVFGGADATGAVLDDLYEYDGAAWHGPLTPAVRPAARRNWGSAATFADGNALAPAARNRVVIFGGELASQATVDDCWAWDGASWTPVCSTCTQTARTGAALGYDPTTGRLVVVNGWTGSGEIAGTFEHLGQFWAETTGLPGNRDHSGIAFDTKRNRFVVFGGNGGSCGGNCDETLEYVAP